MSKELAVNNPDEESAGMTLVVVAGVGLILLLVIAGVLTALPDIMRYMRIRQM